MSLVKDGAYDLIEKLTNTLSSTDRMDNISVGYMYQKPLTHTADDNVIITVKKGETREEKEANGMFLIEVNKEGLPLDSIKYENVGTNNQMPDVMKSLKDEINDIIKSYKEKEILSTLNMESNKSSLQEQR